MNLTSIYIVYIVYMLIANINEVKENRTIIFYLNCIIYKIYSFICAYMSDFIYTRRFMHIKDLMYPNLFVLTNFMRNFNSTQHLKLKNC